MCWQSGIARIRLPRLAFVVAAGTSECRQFGSGKSMTSTTNNHDDLEIPAILRRKPKTPQVAALPGTSPLGMKP